MKKTQKTTTHSAKSATKAKEQKPIISTGKKIGLTIYFTFVLTLMGVMGLQIWLNGPNGLLSNDSINTSPQQTTQTTIDTKDTQNATQNNSTYTSPTNQTNTQNDLISNMQNNDFLSNYEQNYQNDVNYR